MKSWFPLAPLAICSFALAQKVTVELDYNVDFSKYNTFRLIEGQLNSKAAALNNDIIRRKIEMAIRKHLAEEGLIEVDPKPDLNVRYILGAPRKKERELVGVAPPERFRRINDSYTDGTLMIDLRDAYLKVLVWRTKTEDKEDEPKKIANHVEAMVSLAFETYPPKKK